MKWKVSVPFGRWMAGVHSFPSKKRAVEFKDRWMTVECNAGLHPVPEPELWWEA